MYHITCVLLQPALPTQVSLLQWPVAWACPAVAPMSRAPSEVSDSMPAAQLANVAESRACVLFVDCPRCNCELKVSLDVLSCTTVSNVTVHDESDAMTLRFGGAGPNEKDEDDKGEEDEKPEDNDEANDKSNMGNPYDHNNEGPPNKKLKP